MADDHNPMNPYGGRKDDDERGDANGGDGLEEMLRGLMGGGTPDPQMMDALRQMGMGSMDPAQMGMMQAQLQAMMSGDSGSAFNEQLAANVARQVVSAEGDPSVPTSTKRTTASANALRPRANLRAMIWGMPWGVRAPPRRASLSTDACSATARPLCTN